MSADERTTSGERASGDLLQPVLSVRRTFQPRPQPLPGDATHDGVSRRRATQQDRQEPVDRQQPRELRGRHQHGERTDPAEVARRRQVRAR